MQPILHLLTALQSKHHGAINFGEAHELPDVARDGNFFTIGAANERVTKRQEAKTGSASRREIAVSIIIAKVLIAITHRHVPGHSLERSPFPRIKRCTYASLNHSSFTPHHPAQQFYLKATTSPTF